MLRCSEDSGSSNNELLMSRMLPPVVAGTVLAFPFLFLALRLLLILLLEVLLVEDAVWGCMAEETAGGCLTGLRLLLLLCLSVAVSVCAVDDRTGADAVPCRPATRPLPT